MVSKGTFNHLIKNPLISLTVVVGEISEIQISHKTWPINLK